MIPAGAVIAGVAPTSLRVDKNQGPGSVAAVPTGTSSTINANAKGLNQQWLAGGDCKCNALANDPRKK